MLMPPLLHPQQVNAQWCNQDWPFGDRRRDKWQGVLSIWHSTGITANKMHAHSSAKAMAFAVHISHKAKGDARSGAGLPWLQEQH